MSGKLSVPEGMAPQAKTIIPSVNPQLVLPDDGYNCLSQVTVEAIPPATEEYVRFYDYDGTLVASYTLKEAQKLTSLPYGPNHEGLIFQGWN